MLLMCGYGPRSPEDLKTLCEKHEARAVDIRIRPYSKRTEWCLPNLRSVLPGYIHLPEFGNKARFGSGGIEIADVYTGAEKLKALEGNLILFCACGKPDTCHRSELAKDLDVLFKVRTKEAEWPKYQRPPGQYWCRETERVQLDTLAAMEAWCEKRWKSGQGVPTEKFDKLLAKRRGYGLIEVNLRLFMSDGPLPDVFLSEFWHKIEADEKAFGEVLRRLLTAGVVVKYTEESAGENWLMYRLKGEKDGDGIADRGIDVVERLGAQRGFKEDDD